MINVSQYFLGVDSPVWRDCQPIMMKLGYKDKESVSYHNPDLRLQFIASIKNIPLPCVHLTISAVCVKIELPENPRDTRKYIENHSSIIFNFFSKDLKFIKAKNDLKNPLCVHWFALIPPDFTLDEFRL